MGYKFFYLAVLQDSSSPVNTIEIQHKVAEILLTDLFISRRRFGSFGVSNSRREVGGGWQLQRWRWWWCVPDVPKGSMGCGRSRHRSPSPAHHDGNDKENSSGGKQRGGKRQKLSDKTSAKSAAVKRDADVSNSTPTKTNNGKMGGAKTEWQMGGEKIKTDWQKGGAKTDSPAKQGGAKRQWQLEEAVDNQPETVVAVYRSSVPSSARASLNPPPGKYAHSNTAPPNGSLLNGSHKASSTPQDVEMRVSEAQEKSPLKERNSSGNAKPVHITNSQLEFFKMLDEKIEKGPDYDSDED